MFRTCWVLLACALTHTLAKCPEIVSRSKWGAKPSKSQTGLSKSQHIVVIHHTADPRTCSTTVDCKRAVKNIQKFHQDTRKWDDIGYNFLIGNDGKVYEGRGWAFAGAHTPKYNSRSLGIALIGNFNDSVVPNAMAELAKQLIQCGIEKGFIAANYKIFGHRQVKSTECPGNKLFNEIQHWPGFSTIVPK